MSCLAPCPACDRHVSTHEAACPFCAAALPASFRCQPARVAPPGRLGRAARIAAGAALMSAACCSGVALYGAPIIPDAGGGTSGNDGSSSDGSQDRSAEAPVGDPPPPTGDGRLPAPEPKKKM